MNKLIMLLFSLAAFIFGVIFLAYQETWIIFFFPSNKLYEVTTQQQTATSKTIQRYIWKHNTFKQENTHIIWSDNQAQNIHLLLNSWLQFLEEEHLSNKDAQVISVALTPSGKEALICLNQPPFNRQDSTYQKLMWTEGLLKTLRENHISIQAIRLLVHHQPLQDDHLNFDISWPISGYLNS